MLGWVFVFGLCCLLVGRHLKLLQIAAHNFYLKECGGTCAAARDPNQTLAARCSLHGEGNAGENKPAYLDEGAVATALRLAVEYLESLRCCPL